MSLKKLKIFKNRKMWTEALTLAVEQHPTEVVKLLEHCGDHYFAHSKDEKLYNELEKLPDSIKIDPYIIYWRFRSGSRIGKHADLIPLVKKTLDEHEAPELRALYATRYFNNPQKLLAEVERALKVKPVPTVQHYYGIALSQVSTSRAIKYHSKMIKEFEERSDNFWFTLFLSNQGTYYEYQGDLAKGFECFKRALTRLEQVFFSHWEFKIHVIQSYISTALRIDAFDEIPISYIETLEDEIELHSIEKTLITRNTLGQYYTFSQDFEKAKDIYEQLFELYRTEEAFVTNLDTPDMTYNYVKLLLCTQEYEKAAEIASITLAENKSQPRYVLANQLAYALTIVHTKPTKVIELLAEDSDKWNKEIVLQDLRIPAFTLLSYAYLKVGDIEKTTKLLASENLGDLHIDGFRMVMGSEVFDEVYHFWKGNDLLPLLADSKAFDQLYSNEASWNRLALLEKTEGHLEQCRYAQYLLSIGSKDKALAVSCKVFEN